MLFIIHFFKNNKHINEIKICYVEVTLSKTDKEKYWNNIRVIKE